MAFMNQNEKINCRGSSSPRDKAQTIKITETQRGETPLCIPVISIGLSITCFQRVPTRSRHSSGDTSCRCCKGQS